MLGFISNVNPMPCAIYSILRSWHADPVNLLSQLPISHAWKSRWIRTHHFTMDFVVRDALLVAVIVGGIMRNCAVFRSRIFASLDFSIESSLNRIAYSGRGL